MRRVLESFIFYIDTICLLWLVFPITDPRKGVEQNRRRKFMKLDRAKILLQEFLSILSTDRPINFLNSFKTGYKKVLKLIDGSYLFFFEGPYVGNPYHNPEAIIVRQDRKVFEIYGAIAKVFLNLQKIPSNQLGNPLTGERWLGSGPGRYQLFDHGIIKWDGTSRLGGVEDLAHPVLFDRDPREGVEIECVVAFGDIRGFTRWASRKDPQKVQQLIFDVEDALQKHLAKPWFRELFIKGVGDGFMVVLEKELYRHAVSELEIVNSKTREYTLLERRGFVSDFVSACYSCNKELMPMLKKNNLRLGFGIDLGKLKNVLILGRWDYLGEVANTASKLQGEASNSVIFSEKCFNEIEQEYPKLLKGINDKEIKIKSGGRNKKIRVKELKIK
jgi:class 3 adenylate cyclase